jgi:hypothetical protein
MKYRSFFLASIFTILSSLSQAATYYVATDGNDSNVGTSLTSPFKTIAKACGLSTLAAGDQIIVRGGTYVTTAAITFSKSGTAALPISLITYNGERALINFTGIAAGKRGISLSGSYWYIKGLDISKATDNGIYISGASNTIEFCSFYDNGDSGMQLGGGAHDNKILNCDSYWNADPTDYGDADGFACKMDVGTNNYFYGCRSWLNVDDGWDGYLRGADDVSTYLENCWTWRNGYFKDGTDAGANANGNGFKMGGSDTKLLMHNFTLKNCISFNNKAKGFDQNNNKGNMTLFNCTGYGNVGNDFSISSTLNTGKTCTVTNCVDVVKTKVSLGSFVTQTTNSWLSPFTVTSDDFVSLDSLGVTSKRNVDGSLPKLNFLRLKAGSDLIDAGTNIGLPFNGTAPDLGAYEFELPTVLKEVSKNTAEPYFNGNQLMFQRVSLPSECMLFDLQGKQLLHASLNDACMTLNCGHLQKGLYVVEVASVEGRKRYKLIK